MLVLPTWWIEQSGFSHTQDNAPLRVDNHLHAERIGLQFVTKDKSVICGMDSSHNVIDVAITRPPPKSSQSYRECRRELSCHGIVKRLDCLCDLSGRFIRLQSAILRGVGNLSEGSTLNKERGKKSLI